MNIQIQKFKCVYLCSLYHYTNVFRPTLFHDPLKISKHFRPSSNQFKKMSMTFFSILIKTVI